jgi:hypothetical protein
MVLPLLNPGPFNPLSLSLTHTHTHIFSQVGPEQRRNEQEVAVPSQLNPEPMEYRPVPPSAHTYHMVDGVMQVWSHAVLCVGSLVHAREGAHLMR